MATSDKTKEVLEQILAQLYSEQAQKSKVLNGSYLIAQDRQFLGRINNNHYDTESIINQYGPFGSQYSSTSIHNAYSQYGSQYGAYSLNNPYCTQPPKLFLNERFIGYITANQHITDRISAEAFLYALENDLPALLKGKRLKPESKARQLIGESYIETQDGTFLGKLNPNQFDQESIFNQFAPYGNKFSQSSIFNKFSPYGNQFSKLSAYNKFTRSPPRIIVEGSFFAYLTVNKTIKPRIDPSGLLNWAEKNVSKIG